MKNILIVSPHFPPVNAFHGATALPAPLAAVFQVAAKPAARP